MIRDFGRAAVIVLVLLTIYAESDGRDERALATFFNTEMESK
jgi:hypothetical protein